MMDADSPEIEMPAEIEPIIPRWTGPTELEATLADLDRRLQIIEVQLGLSTIHREVGPRKGHPANVCKCLECRKSRIARG